MKLFVSLIFALLFSFLTASVSFAEEADDWTTLMKDYNDNTFGKIISNQDYKKAVETKQSFIKKPKKSKNPDKAGKPTEAQTSEGVSLESPVSHKPLLTLPVNVYYENKIIQKGFYLVNLKHDGGRYFLELMQGDNLPVAVIEAKGHNLQGKAILAPQVSVENVGDKMIKINYSGDNLILESVLWAEE